MQISAKSRYGRRFGIDFFPIFCVKEKWQDLWIIDKLLEKDLWIIDNFHKKNLWIFDFLVLLHFKTKM